ncbi:MAG: AAA-like domain-containing protein [Candidatus Aminicenantes bacterium]|nr:AAA-like domain-containing protein [Candidatus Aminicenantes bacterium]
MSNLDKRDDAFYIVGGAMRPDAPSYIERNADQKLYERTLAGDFCYVLTPRQMGKSSLMARTADRLTKEGVRTAIVDLTQIGTEQEKNSADRWYYGIAHRIVKEMGIAVKLSQWWEEREKLPALQRLTEFFADVILAGTNEQVVIFVDEIDTTIGLPFTDDFFAAIRACYNARATQPGYRRLSFVLIGVATPSQLIKNARRTPFNIGQQIELTDFTFEEAQPLSRYLGANRNQGEDALKRILYWSGGHPYLTQRLCCLAAGEKLEVYLDDSIDRLVEKHFLAPGVNCGDSNIKFVRDRLLQKKKYSRKLLTLYLRIFKGRFIMDEPLSFTHAFLKLSGLVVPSINRKLCVRNRIYKSIFTREWVKEAMPINWPRDISIASIAVLLLGLAIWYTQLLPRLYIEVIRTAIDDVPVGAYEKLRNISNFADKADDLLAGYWDRRALRTVAQGKRDEGLLYYLKAITVKDTGPGRYEAGRLTSGDYTELQVTYRCNSGVRAVAFSPKCSPNGETVLTGSSDGTARLWRAEDGKPIAAPLNHGGWINAVAFSPDGKTVLTGSLNGTARLWRADNGRLLAEPIRHGGRIYAAAFSPDGKTVLTGSDDGTARLWWADNGKPMTKPIKHGGWVLAVAFSPDGNTVLTGSDDGTAQFWRADNSSPLGKPIRHGGRITAVAFSPDGKTVLSGSDNGTARLWRADNGSPIGEPIKHERPVTAVAFSSPDGKTVLTGSSDGTARMWLTGNGSPTGELINYGDWITAAAFSPDGNIVLTGSSDGTARFWRADNGSSIGEPIKSGSHFLAVAFSPDGNTVLTGSSDGTAQFWRADDCSPIGEPIKHGGRVYAVAFSPDGKTVLTGSDDGTVRLWQSDKSNPMGDPLKHGGRIYAVAFSSDSKTALTGSSDGTVRLWRTDDRKPLSELIKPGGRICAVAFSPDGKAVITATDWWIHQYVVDENTLKPKASRLLPGVGTGAYHFLDDKGDTLQMAALITGDSIKIITVRFDIPDAPPIQGDPKKLLAEWQKKLALKLNDDGKIEPMYLENRMMNDEEKIEGEKVRG